MDRISQLFFLALFPGLFFYSSAVSIGLIPAIIGGGFGVLTALAIVLLAPFVLIDIPQLRGLGLLFTLIFAVLVAFSAGWAGLHFLLGGVEYGRYDIKMQWVDIIASWCGLFAIGYFWPRTCSRLFVAALWVFLLGMCIVIALNINPSLMMYRLGVSGVPGTLSYQGLARSAVLTGVVVMVIARRPATAAMAGGLTLFATFFIGARSELAGLVCAFPFIVFLHFRHRPIAFAKYSVTGILGIIGLVYFSGYDIMASRQMQLLDLSTSTSASSRSLLQVSANQAIIKSPIMGDFAGHAINADNPGSYAHNLTSAWRQLGLLAFALYTLLLLIPVGLTARRAVKYGGLSIQSCRVTGALSIFVLALCLAAKSVFWPVPALVWGLFVASCKHRANPRSKIDQCRYSPRS